MNRKFLLIFLMTSQLFSQTNYQSSSIGYVYPSGGQKGTNFEVIVGGQNLRGVKNVLFSTDGIKAEEFLYIPFLNPKQKRLLLRKIGEIIRSRFRNSVKKVESQKKDEDVKLPNNPLLNDLENKTIDEIKKIIELFLTPFRREQIKRSIQEKVLIKVNISDNVEPGIYQLRLVTSSGITNPLNFYVSEVKEVKEDFSIPFFDLFKKEKKVFEPPVIINGQITPGDVDRFYFKGKKGQKLIIELKGREIIPFMADAVPGWLQGVITIYDPEGKEIAYCDDFYFNPAPLIFFEVPEDGEYMVEVRDALYRGREDFVYRLFIGEKPYVISVFPAGGERYERTISKIYGFNLPKSTIELDTSFEENGIYKTRITSNGIYSNEINYMVGDLPEMVEKEPNDTIKNANEIRLPKIINGIIEKSGDVDIYKFKCKKGFKLVCEVYGRRLLSPIDSYICLMDSNGKVLISNDDYYDKNFDLITHHADSYIYYEIPEDGTYYLKIVDIQNKGGYEYFYRLRVSEPICDFSLFVYPSSINIPSVGKTPLNIYVFKKDGFDEEIEISLKSPFEGLFIDNTKIPKGKDKITVNISADSKFPVNKPVKIEIEGIANLNGEILRRIARPTDEVMQAFSYTHLIPSSDLIVYVLRRFQRGNLREIK